MRVGAPSAGGNLPVMVGRRRFGVPQGTRLSHQTLKNGSPICYALHGQDLRVLLAHGEILDIPADLGRVVAKKIFGVETLRTVAGELVA